MEAGSKEKYPNASQSSGNIQEQDFPPSTAVTIAAICRPQRGLALHSAGYFAKMVVRNTAMAVLSRCIKPGSSVVLRKMPGLFRALEFAVLRNEDQSNAFAPSSCQAHIDSKGLASHASPSVSRRLSACMIGRMRGHFGIQGYANDYYTVRAWMRSVQPTTGLELSLESRADVSFRVASSNNSTRLVDLRCSRRASTISWTRT
jgi:hypothetical protein